MKKRNHFSELTNLPNTPPEAQMKPKEAPQTFVDPIDIPPDEGEANLLEEPIRIPKTLRTRLVAEANSEGVSLSEYIIYKLTR